MAIATLLLKLKTLFSLRKQTNEAKPSFEKYNDPHDIDYTIALGRAG